jgi:hypothetical protein
MRLRLEGSGDMRLPPKLKSLQKETEVLWRLDSQYLLVAFFHGRLQKVRVVLKVERRTELFGNWAKNRSFSDCCLDPLIA